MKKGLIFFSVVFSGVFLAGTAFSQNMESYANPQNPEIIVYRVDVDSSKVLWFCEQHTGFIHIESGYFNVKGNDIVGGFFAIDMGSLVNTDIDYDLMRGTLENILKSNEFFNIEEYPLTTFEVSSIRKLENNEQCISGDMQVLDVTRRISFHSDIIIDNKIITATSEKFIIDRTEWGITTMSKNHVESDKSFIVSDEIGIIIQIIAVSDN